MKKVKQFVRDYKKGLVIAGGVTLLAILAVSKLKTAKVETIVDLPGYDIWAMVGTKCSQELFDDVTILVGSYGKTINFEILD